MRPGRFEAGHVSSVNPARREVRIRTERAHHFLGPAWIDFVLEDASAMRCKVAAARAMQSGAVMVTLSAGTPCDTVARMKGAAVLAPPEDGPSMDAAEMRPAGLIGLEVYDEAGGRLGRVAAAYETGANGVIEIARSGGGTMILPVIKPVVAGIDWERGALRVRDIAPYKVEDAD